jgi:hypothetical protein
MLRPVSVAEFYADVLVALAELGVDVKLNPKPCEIPNATPFPDDTVHKSYDGAAAQRFHGALLAAHDVLTRFRTGFLGKVSPVHFFWGSFDLAVTRFSGRRAPPHPGGVPGLPDSVAREAYSHEVSSAGFWPGGGPIDYPAFYSYAYPAPEGFAAARVEPSDAFFSKELGEFILPYDAVRSARARAGAAGVSSVDLCGRCRSREMGSHRARMRTRRTGQGEGGVGKAWPHTPLIPAKAGIQMPQALTSVTRQSLGPRVRGDERLYLRPLTQPEPRDVPRHQPAGAWSTGSG